MKEKEFEKQLKEMDFSNGLVIKVYYTTDDEDNVILDEEGIGEEFEMKMRELNEILE